METEINEKNFTPRYVEAGRWKGVGRGKCSIRDNYICFFEDIPFLVHKGYAMVLDSRADNAILVMPAGTSELRRKVTKSELNGKKKTTISVNNKYLIQSGFYDYKIVGEKIHITNIHYYTIEEVKDIREQEFRHRKEEDEELRLKREAY